MDRKKEFDFFDRPTVIRRLWVFLYASCAILVIPDFFSRPTPDFGIDGMWGFYAILGFASCAVLILFSKAVGLFLKKREDYYDD